MIGCGSTIALGGRAATAGALVLRVDPEKFGDRDGDGLEVR